MLERNKDSFDKDLKEGRVIINKNGHVVRFDSSNYESLLGNWGSFGSDIRTCYLCGKNILFQMDGNRFSKEPININAFSWDYEKGSLRKNIHKSSCSMASHEKQEGAYQIIVPTGELIIGNYFLDKDGEYAFDVPKESRYLPKYDICNIKGQNNRANYVAKEYNIGYVQINSSVEVWASKDENKILLVMSPCDWEEIGAKNKKLNNKFEENHKKLGELDQQVWRYEFADKSVVDSYNAKISQQYDSLNINIPKGVYIVKHHYGKMYFNLNNKRYVVVTEIELVANSREVIVEKK